MRLYRTSTGQWVGTQNDAAGIARANGGTWEQIDVPTDKPNLIAWLNGHCGSRVPSPSTAPTDAEAQRAENVAWRFHELARHGPRKPS